MTSFDDNPFGLSDQNTAFEDIVVHREPSNRNRVSIGEEGTLSGGEMLLRNTQSSVEMS